jgi:hypothetical protein
MMREPKPKDDTLNETHRASQVESEKDTSGAKGDRAMDEAAKGDPVGEKDTSGEKAKDAMKQAGR